MEQGSKEIKLQGRYPEYTVYSHPIPQRALAIATLLLQMKNSEHVYIINSVYCLSGGCHYFMSWQLWHGCIHMKWTRCIMGNPSEAG